MGKKSLVTVTAGTIVAAIGFANAANQTTSAPQAHAPVSVRLIAHVTGRTSDGDSHGGNSSFIELSNENFGRGELSGNGKTCRTSGAEPDVVWTFEARLIGATEDQAVVDLAWSRTIGTPAVFSEQSFSQRGKVQLRHDERLPLDIVRVNNPDANGCDRLIVSVGFDLAHDRSVQDVALRHDLWLLQREAGGHEFSDRVQYTGRQDGEAEYLFRPLYYTETGSSSRSPDDAALELEISGELRSRARADGLIDVTLQTWRRFYEKGARAKPDTYKSLMWIGPGDSTYEEDSRGMFGNGGSKLLTVRSGETIEVALPPVTGKLKGRDLSQVFAGQATALRLTTTRLR